MSTLGGKNHIKCRTDIEEPSVTTRTTLNELPQELCPVKKKTPSKKPLAVSRNSVLRPKVKDMDVGDSKKDGAATKKRKVWVPPGLSGVANGSAVTKNGRNA